MIAPVEVPSEKAPKPVKTLTLDQDLNVQYCIPTWLRDEQVKLNTATCKGRIEAVQEIRHDPIALVSYGPSLNDTWEQIRDFKYIMTCSGAHPFLIERGIIPTWHIAVDPLPKHTETLIGTPHPDVEYLIASTCHPGVFEYLKDYNLKLWHIFDSDEEGMRMLPRNEWALTGGCSAGVRTLTLARFLGFVNLHVFGMDGSYGESGRHAGTHPSPLKDYCVIDYEGRTFKTTPSMLQAVKTTWHELDVMKDVTVKFYGDGLTQTMAAKYCRKQLPGVPLIGFNKPELVSASYRQLNQQLHRDNLAYGVGGGKHADIVMQIMKDAKLESVLDYGCGKGYLAKKLPFPIWEYDPAIPGKDEEPRPADLVVCTDVLEHVEKDHLLAVLDDLRRCVKKVGFFTIDTLPSSKTLPDGRNTHLIQKGVKWWAKKLNHFFKIASIKVQSGRVLYFVVSPKKK